MSEVGRVHNRAGGAGENRLIRRMQPSAVIEDLVVQLLLAQAAARTGSRWMTPRCRRASIFLPRKWEARKHPPKWKSDHEYTEQTFQSALKRASEAAWMRDKIVMVSPVLPSRYTSSNFCSIMKARLKAF